MWVELQSFVVNMCPFDRRFTSMHIPCLKGGYIDAIMIIDHTALPCNADRRPDVIAGNHSTGYMGTQQRPYGSASPCFQFVLEDYQAQEAKLGFDLLTTRS